MKLKKKLNINLKHNINKIEEDDDNYNLKFFITNLIIKIIFVVL